MTDASPDLTRLPLEPVALVRWPESDDVRQSLAASRHPRLLLVAAHAQPPDIDDELEDWVREPAPEAEITARSATLRRRAGHDVEAPQLDDDGLLRLGSRWVAIPDAMIPVVRTLVRQPNQLVRDRQLISAYADGGGSTTPGAIKGMLGRLDERVRAVGLRLRRVKSRGVVLVVP